MRVGEVAEAAAGIDTGAHQLLDLLGVGKATVALAFPDQVASEVDLENAAGAGNERHLAHLEREGRQHLLGHPGSAQQPVALGAISDGEFGLVAHGPALLAQATAEVEVAAQWRSSRSSTAFTAVSTLSRARSTSTTRLCPDSCAGLSANANRMSVRAPSTSARIAAQPSVNCAASLPGRSAPAAMSAQRCRQSGKRPIVIARMAVTSRRSL